jgi:hypothetical protein
MSIKDLTPAEQKQLIEIFKIPPRTEFGTPVFFKRHIVGDGKGGYSLIPFGKYDYGYPMKEWVMMSWPVWGVEIAASFSESWTRGFAINSFAHFVQESLMPKMFPELRGGASFVHNLLAGYNVVRNWNSKSGMRKWARYAGYLDILTDIALIPVEKYRLEAEFGALIGHKFHLMGLVVGSIVAFI